MTTATGLQPPMAARMTRAIFLLLITAAIWPSAIAWAEAGEDEDAVRKVQAAYLYNFTKFITWPEQAFEGGDSPIVLAVLGDDPFGDILEATVAERRAGSRPIEIRRFDPKDDKFDADRLKQCHLVFISRSESKRVDRWLEFFEDTGTVTVSDIDRFAPEGGMIGLVLRDRRIVFEINRRAVDRSELTFSSRLLQLATIVESEPSRS